MKLVFDELQISDEGRARYFDKRKAGERVLSVEGFGVFVGEQIRDLRNLRQIATIYSGRRGIALSVASDIDDKINFGSKLGNEEPSAINFNVRELYASDSFPLHLGSISFQASIGKIVVSR
jgi:hypothetical protein